MVNDTVYNKLKHLEIINVESKLNFLGNYKCHMNCLNYARKHKSVVKIVGVAQVFNDNGIVAHFIVKLKNGTYLDPSYGRLSSIGYQYNIKIEEYNVETFNPSRELSNLKEYLFYKLPWYVRLFKNKHNTF